MQVTRKTVLKIFLPLIAAAVLAYALGAGRAERVAVIRPVYGPAVQAVYATGTVEPSVMVPIAGKRAAVLLAFSADEGQNVTKGQVLAQLEDDELQKALAEMEAVAALAEKEFARRSALVQKNAVSEQSLDQARSNLDAAKARVAQAQANLDEMKLVAPEDGIIIRRDGEIGELIAANQPVFWMSCCSGLRVAAEVDEEDIALVKPGQKVLIRADAFPGKIFDGTVQSITPKGDPVSRNYRVRIGLEADTPLMIGMTAETNIILREEKTALLVPATALHDGAVWIVKDGKAALQTVETGAKSPGAVEIRSGIGADALIVRDASAGITPGKHLRAQIETWKAP